MFASSPAVSALEHPVYDVWVVDCEEPIAPPGNDQGVGEQHAAVIGIEHRRRLERLAQLAR